MARLALEHSISVKDLISPRLMAGFARDYLVSSHGTGSSSWSRASRAINGTGVWARDAVRSLESLVERSDLTFLTMLPWAEVVPARSLLKQSKAWCPECYRGWAESGSPIYDPIVWLLSPVHMCVRHRRQLESACPQCRRAVPCLSSQAVSGYCPYCGVPLSDAPARQPSSPPLDPRFRQWQAWILGQLERMFSSAVSGGPAPNREHVQIFYQRCARSVFAGCVSETARLIQVSPRTMREWIAGSQLPTLEHLLVSCYCFHSSAADVLRGLAKPPSLADVRMPLWMERQPLGRPPRVLDKDAIRSLLQDVLDANYLFPPSMADVSRSLDIDASHLVRLLPGLCKQISRRYLTHVSELRARSLNRTMTEVGTMVRTLHRNGDYPGYDPVSSRLPRPWAMRSNEVRAIWKASLDQIGHERENELATLAILENRRDKSLPL
jgi:hypothetical protein